MKVFISHKKEDEGIATAIHYRLRILMVESFLDVMEPESYSAGDDLVRYLRDKLSECTHLIAVISRKTQMSWWVPWEIGVATERDYPLSTYAADSGVLPEFLKKWPYLQTMNDVDKYVESSRRSRRVIAERFGEKYAGFGPLTTREFHADLKRALGQ